MIYYATKETMQRYKLKTPEKLDPSISPLAQTVKQKEAGQRIYEWGCKLFYFDRRKCLQIMHFETKLVIYLVDLKMAEREYAGDAVAHYLMDMYESDRKMCRALRSFFASAPVVIFDQITDRSMITCMNSMLNRWAMDGYRFYDYISGGILHTKKINRDVNEMPVTVTIDGKKEWIVPYEYFAQVIKERFLSNDERRTVEL